VIELGSEKPVSTVPQETPLNVLQLVEVPVNSVERMIIALAGSTYRAIKNKIEETVLI
jgi:hypothetical protein